MSKPSSRPGREEIKTQRKERKRIERELRKRQEIEGLTPPKQVCISNGKSEYRTVEEEREARTDAAINQARILQSRLPVILKRLAKIADPRNPRKIKHKLTVLMVYGILTFVYQMASRREANSEMTRPMFVENLMLLFPGLESIPHHDTLMRLLCRIDVNQIESANLDLVKNLIRKKKFKRYLVDQYYPVAIDGTQKLVRDTLWSEECLERKVKEGEGTAKQYYVYVLEANLVFSNGMNIPLMSEFLSYTDGDISRNKQDCELEAFKRLAKRLKAEFPCLRIMVLADGLYPNGPVMNDICRKYGWQFMIVLQDKSLPSVWEEYDGLKGLQPDNKLKMNWGNRRQQFQWVNNIYYYYGPNGRKKLTLHLVTCEESWEELDKHSNEVITKTSRHAWISSEPLDKGNIHKRCNLGARHRWGIESSILVEKRQGYQYEHCFSYDWHVMKGYHYLMRLGHALNVLAQYAECLGGFIKNMGVRGFIHFIKGTLSAPWFSDPQRVKDRIAVPFQLRLI